MAKHSDFNINEALHNISFHPRDRVKIFLDINHEARSTVLLRLTRHIQYDLAMRLPEDELIETLEHLDPDQATDIIQLLPRRRQVRILKKLSTGLREGVEILSQFDPKTAAGLMDIDYIQVDEMDKVSTVAKKFKAHEKRTGRTPTIIAMRNGTVAGTVPGHELVFARTSQRIKKFVRRIYKINHDAGHEEVVKVFREHPHTRVAVLGSHGNVVGIIYSDDVLRILEEQQSASLYDFAGVHEEETVTDTVSTKVHFRYKWLITNLATAFLAAFTVRLFDETISKYVLLAVYMPIVAGMGGNAATQTLAVLVRGIALKEIELKNCWKTLLNEVGAGFVNGVINAVLVAGVILLLNDDLKLAIVLAAAMIFNLVIAAIFGTLVPLIMKRIGKDPAASATIFITTATDVLGFLVFLGLAAVVLG